MRAVAVFWVRLVCSLAAASVVIGSARAQAEPPGALSVMPLPGGLRAALSALGDPVPADRSRFLVEFIRRTYYAPIVSNSDPRLAALTALLEHLDRSSRQGDTAAAEWLPLPLSDTIWIKDVFGGRAARDTLVLDILRSRSAALFYCGLLSLDEDTRAWVATQPDLIPDLSSQHAPAFVIAAPGLRVAAGAVNVPGGELAESGWRALVGHAATEPAAFVRTLLKKDDGRLAYFLGTVGQLTPAQVRHALNLDARDERDRISAIRRLYGVFARLATDWKIEERTFWRPGLDPALLVSDLHVDGGGRPVVPGSRRFWNAVFVDGDPELNAAEKNALREPVDLTWLSEQVFKSEPIENRRRYHIVLFASRILGSTAPVSVRDALDMLRAAGKYPALTAVLERAGLVDVGAFAAAARRATQLSAISDGTRAERATAQFQGAVALVTRTALRRRLAADAVANVVSSLAAVDVSEQGDYEGRLVRWLVEWVNAQVRKPASPAPEPPHPAIDTYVHATTLPAGGDVPLLTLDHDVLQTLAGGHEPSFVEWEGTRYRVDLERAEAVRLARLLGENARPYVSSAHALLITADQLERQPTREVVAQQADRFEQVTQAVMLDRTDPYRNAALELRRAARGGDAASAARLVPTLRVMSDDLLAQGLMAFTYAVALGHPDRVSISAGEAASRHDFALRSGSVHRPGAWQLATDGADVVRGWRVTGSLLGLDVSLSEFSLVSLAARPPARKPSVADADRRLLTEAVALVAPASLVQADAEAILAAIQRGRARLAEIRTPVEAAAVAGEIPLGPIGRSLLPWAVAHDRTRVAAFLSTTELFWLGLEKRPIDARFDAWGAHAGPRLGCFCLRLSERPSWEALAGRWSSGISLTGFSDLNLRLTELLTALHMPAALLGSILGPATRDFITMAVSRDQDDRRGLVEFVQGMRTDRVEHYLSFLTVDGPLVPVGEAASSSAAGSVRGQVPQ